MITNCEKRHKNLLFPRYSKERIFMISRFFCCCCCCGCCRVYVMCVLHSMLNCSKKALISVVCWDKDLITHYEWRQCKQGKGISLWKYLHMFMGKCIAASSFKLNKSDPLCQPANDNGNSKHPSQQMREWYITSKTEIDTENAWDCKSTIDSNANNNTKRIWTE